MVSNQQQIVLGALVQWAESDIFGIITSFENGMVQVAWDEDGCPPQFRAAGAPLKRIDLLGQTVNVRSTGATAAVMRAVESSPPAWQCFVAADGGKNINISEADLRLIPINDAVERFQESHIGPLKKYRLQEATRWYRGLHLYDELVSLGQVGVDIKPHQVSVVHKVISNYPHRFLLCDEVGLGKTIEAGMTLKELRARGGARRVLIIVPPNLVRQWQFEMKSKFNESFSVLNTNTVRYMEGQGQTANPFTYFDNVICSAAWLSNPQWGRQCSVVDWDLVIVDEAHHARSHRNGNRVTTTQLYELVRDLAAPQHFARRGMLFLTATPMQLNTHEIYSLVELLDPALFPSEKHFEDHRRKVPGLSYLVERLIENGFPLPNEAAETTIEQVAQWLELDESEAQRRLSGGRESIEALANELSDCHLLSTVMIRNRKAVVGGFIPRSVYRWAVDLTEEERIALAAVEDYVQYGFQMAEGTNDSAVGFVMVTFQKLMASSIAAIRHSLTRRRERVKERFVSQQSASEMEDRLDYDDNAGDVVEAAGTIKSLANEELRRLDDTLASLNLVKTDSKSLVLLEKLAELFGDSPDEKVIVFTQFRETQRFLEELLTARGWSVNLFHGQMKPEDKDNAVDRFKSEKGSQILISTEAGGEGRNFQFCHYLVNYDLPWNPMRVEQRIGRVDRIGQEEAISIFNLWVKDTIEERVLEVLENRIQVFQETVGGLDAILGETENDIQKIMRQAVEQRGQALEEYGQQLELRVRDARQAAARLGDFIMDTKSYRKELAERIAGQPSPVNNEDFEKFIGQLLADVHTYIRQKDGVYELTFHSSFVDAPNHRTLFLAGDTKKAVFRPDRRPDSEAVEFMVFGHPVVDAVVEQVLAEGYEGITGTRRILAGDDLSPVSGWLFTYQFEISGPWATERILPIFVSDYGQVNIDLGRKLAERACRFDEDEEEIDPSLIPDNLKVVEPVANRAATDERESLQLQIQSQAAERVDQEVTRLTAYFDYREMTAGDKVAETRATLNRIRESEDESERRILPAWEANLRRDEATLAELVAGRPRRIEDAEKHRRPGVAWALKSLGRIEVVKGN